MTTNFEILERAEKIELLLGELYESLGRHFRADPAALDLFTRLRDEERQHAARVRMLASQARHDTKLLARITVDRRRIDAIVEEVGAFLLTTGRGEWRLDLAATRDAMRELEERCALAHTEGLEGLDPSLRAFFEQLAAQDKAHAELLGARGAPRPRT